MTKSSTKRILAGVLSILCASGVVTAQPYAGVVADTAVVASAEETSVDYQYRSLDDGTIEIAKYIGYAKDLEIPAEIGGHRVSSIGSKAFYNRTTLENVTIPDSVISIGDMAFMTCTKLTSITIPDSVTSIGGNAFANCRSLESITIPDSVTSIGNSAFLSCALLDSVVISNSVTSLGYGIFGACSSLTSVTIPDSVASIGDNAFSNCSSLSSVNIPDSVASIGDNAFSNCSSLSSVNIPNSVTSIGESVFGSCTALTDITIPDSVTSICNGTFSGCTALTDIAIPDSITTIGDNAFLGCTALTDITIPDGVTSIGEFAFNGCSLLTDITIPDGVTSIGRSTFGSCTLLTSITIPNSVTSIGLYAFAFCSSLTDVTIPDNVDSIGEYAFYNCNQLKSVKIPGSVTEIGNGAFGYVGSGNPSEFTAKKDDFKIKCYHGTAGEQYAIDNGFECRFISDEHPNPTVTFEKGNGAVRLTWEKVEGAEKYGIVGFVDGEWKLLESGPATASSYILRNLKAGTNYQVAIIAMFDGEWNWDVSNAITVTPNAPVYPETSVEVRGNAFRLNWTTVPNAQKYGIAYSTNNGKSWKVLKTVTDNTLTCRNVPKGNYYLVVCANVNGKYDTTNIADRMVKVEIK